MEALLRWHDPELGYMPPDRFIPFAEQCGLINDIGVWVLRKASAQVRTWNEVHNSNLRVAVNISPIHISTSSFVEMVLEVMAEIKIDPQF